MSDSLDWLLTGEEDALRGGDLDSLYAPLGLEALEGLGDLTKHGSIASIGEPSPNSPQIRKVPIEDALDGRVKLPYRIENLTMRADTAGMPIDLRRLAVRARNVEYNPSRNGGLIIRFRKLNVTAVVFTNGVMSFLGARSLDIAKRAAKTLQLILETLDGGMKIDWMQQLKAKEQFKYSHTDLFGALETTQASGDLFEDPFTSTGDSTPSENLLRDTLDDYLPADVRDDPNEHFVIGIEKPYQQSHDRTGTSTPDANHGDIADPLSSQMKALRFKPIIQNLKVVNIVASSCYDMPVRLDVLACELPEYCSYEPEIFSGALVRNLLPTECPKATALVL